MEKCPPKKIFRLGKSFLQNRLKRVFPKFHAKWSHARGVNDLLKFSIFPKNVPRKFFSPRKIIFAKSSETCFPKVSRRSGLCSGSKRPFKIFEFFKKCSPGKKIRLGRSFLQNHLKPVSPKFHADRSYPRGVNDLSKFSKFS